MKHDNLPKKDTIWLLFDLDNGDSGSKHYVWWFDSRKKAREHKKRHLKRRAWGSNTDLVGPVKAKVSKILKGAFKGTRLEPAKGICFRIVDPLGRRCERPDGHSGPCSPKALAKDQPKGSCLKKIDLVQQGTTRRCLRSKGHKGDCSPYANQ